MKSVRPDGGTKHPLTLSITLTS